MQIFYGATMTTEELQCYNKGCLQKFRETDNNDKACTYHAGEPVFHDVYKYWSCCKKKTTDFTVFLNTKGCTIGCHNPVKPPEPIKNEEKTEIDDKKIIRVEAPKPPRCAPRLAENHPRKRLPIQIAQSLKSHLTKKSNPEDDENDRMKNGDESDNEIPVGTRCKRAGCTKEYFKGISPDEVCWYHSGSAIFHEGMKYWSCCQRKTSDFETFLQQTGCTSGTHLWKKEETSSDAQTVTACRYDWHQTGNDVYVTIYAKCTQPVDSYVEVNAVNLTAHIEFDDCRSIFDLEIPLWGAIDVANSFVTMTAAKVEVRMKKKDNFSWPRINYS